MSSDHAQEPSLASRDARAARRWVALGAAWIGALLIAATVLAVRAQHQVFPSLVIDPFGSFSGVSLPSWHADALPLRFPDRLVAIDDTPLSRQVRYGDSHLLTTPA